MRFRTIGDATCTAAVESTAATVADIVAETSVARLTERAPPGPTTASPKPAWKTASARDISEMAFPGHAGRSCRLPRWRSVARVGRRTPSAPDAAAPLHFATVGSVDDGKSTLIGRLLHDSKSIFEDQLEHIAAVSKRRGDDYVDLALLTDGLRAEREQGITIDVAYRYFSTPHRDFVIADCPGTSSTRAT